MAKPKKPENFRQTSWTIVLIVFSASRASLRPALYVANATRIRDGGPSADDLVDALVLDRFGIVPRMRPALAGVADGHPILGNKILRTSEL